MSHPVVDAARSGSGASQRGSSSSSPESRQPRRAQVCTVLFGLLLVVSLVLPLVAAVEPTLESSVTFAGLMVLCGVSDLVDDGHRVFRRSLQIGGASTALLGLVLRFL